MVTTENLYPRRRATAKTWIALAAAVAAVVVLVILVAVACNGGSGGGPGSAEPTSTAVDDDVPGDGQGGIGSDGTTDGPDDGSGEGDGGDGDGGEGEGEGAGGAPLAGYELVSRTIDVPGGDYRRETVSCPPGKVALGGGAQVVGAGSSEFPVAIQETTVGTTGGAAGVSLWLVSIRNDGPGTRTVGLRVACALPPAGYEVVRLDVPLPAGGYARDGAECPLGKVVLGGGAQVVGAGSQNFMTTVQESTPGEVGSPARAQWLMSVRNGSATDRNLGIHAVCADPVAGYEIAVTTLDVAVGDYAREGTLCPDGTVLLSGGASVIGAGSADFGTTLRESMPGEVGLPAQPVWLVSISNTGTADRDIRMRAVCAAAE